MAHSHSSTGAVLFLCAMAAGAVLLLTGLAPTAPAREGVRLPQRKVAYTAQAGMSDGRRGPGQRGEAVPVQTESPFERIRDFLSTADAAANSALDKGHLFIQLYGGVQALSDRTVLEDVDPQYSVVKLTDGTLTFINAEPQDVTGHGRSVVRLSRALAGREIPLLYVQAPQKLQEDDPRLPTGVADYGNDYADQLLGVLAENDVPTLDLRKTLAAAGRDWSSFFFRTDHHWTPEAAFIAHQAIAEVLERDYGFPIPAEHTDPAAFTRTCLSDWFLGSQGKRVGPLYAGVDDMEIWEPNFATDFTYSIPIYDTERTGSFSEALLFPERVEEKDFFNGNPYTLYAGGDYPMARIYNLLAPERPRIMLLRDSYACVLTPFLALDCGELITVDLRYFHNDLLTYVDWLEPDLVIVMYTAGSVALDELFDFFPQDAPQPPYALDPPAVEKPALGTN